MSISFPASISLKELRLRQADSATIWTKSASTKPTSAQFPNPRPSQPGQQCPGKKVFKDDSRKTLPSHPSGGRNLRAPLGLRQVQERIRLVQPCLGHQEILESRNDRSQPPFPLSGFRQELRGGAPVSLHARHQPLATFLHEPQFAHLLNGDCVRFAQDPAYRPASCTESPR